jgi:8-hydroxy-5-deazaflavin:NADPH oxidoreductase
MKITTIGRGNIGGGLARFWEQAGHDVSTLGHDGGDASNADAVLVAVPSDSIAEALGKVTGIEGKVAIDGRTPFTGATRSTSRSRTK